MTDRYKTTLEDRGYLVEDAWCAGMMRPDTLDPIIWAAAFIWAGLVMLTNGLGYLDGQAWSLFFLGAGGLVLIELAIRLVVPVHRKDLLGTFVLAAVLLALGTGTLGLVLSLILLGIGAYILLRGVFRTQPPI